MKQTITIEAKLDQRNLSQVMGEISSGVDRLSKSLDDFTVADISDRFREGANNTAKAAETFEQRMEAVNSALQEGFSSVVSHLQSEFLSFVQTGELNFRSMVDAIIQDLARISFDQFVTQPLNGLFEGLINSLTGSSKGGGGLSSLLSAGLSVLSGSGGGAKALGGPVSFGRPYVVGERGRELFVPNTSGRIVPNGAMGGGQIVFNVNAADAQSFQRSETQIAAMLNRMVRRGQRNL